MLKAIRFKKVTGTRSEKIEQYKKQWEKAEKDIKAEKVICLSDLMGNAENIHLS